MDDTKWVPRKCLILKGRKFHYAEEQHVNFIKGKELGQKRAAIAMKTGLDALYWGRRRYLQVKYNID